MLTHGEIRMTSRLAAPMFHAALRDIPDVGDLRTGAPLTTPGWRKGNRTHWLQWRDDHGCFYVSKALGDLVTMQTKDPQGIKLHSRGNHAVKTMEAVLTAADFVAIMAR